MCNNNNEQRTQQQIKWGDARSQMRITLEIFFMDNGALINVKSTKDDILPNDNDALFLVRSEICRKIGKAADGVIKSACGAMLDIAKMMRLVGGNESVKAKVAEIEAAFGSVKEDDEQSEKED